MERTQLTAEQYAAYVRIEAEKRAIKELVASLKTQLITCIVREDKWWREVATEHSLDTSGSKHQIDHATQEILSTLKKESITQPAEVKQEPTPQGIRLRERTPEMNEILSPDEIAAMEELRKQIENKRGEQSNESKSK